MFRRGAVELERDSLYLFQALGPYESGGLAEVDVLVVPLLGLGRGREDRRRQAVGFAKPRRQRVAGR